MALKNRYELVSGVWGFPWAKARKREGKWIAAATTSFADGIHKLVAKAEKVTTRRYSTTNTHTQCSYLRPLPISFYDATPIIIACPHLAKVASLRR